jgi:BolA family transcriptional regulator, general stress-responsive regulator
MAQGKSHGQSRKGSTFMNMKERIAAKLTEGLHPTTLDIVDESDRHKGHAGARTGGETHYRVSIVSASFAGKGRVERHRIIYALLADEIAAGVHALALHPLAPGEA